MSYSSQPMPRNLHVSATKKSRRLQSIFVATPMRLPEAVQRSAGKSSAEECTAASFAILDAMNKDKENSVNESRENIRSSRRNKKQLQHQTVTATSSASRVLVPVPKSGIGMTRWKFVYSSRSINMGMYHGEGAECDEGSDSAQAEMVMNTDSLESETTMPLTIQSESLKSSSE